MLNIILQAGTLSAPSNADTINNSVTQGIQTAISTPEITEIKISLIEMVMKGGPIMAPITLLLLISIYVLIERLLVIGKASKKNESLLSSLKEMVHNGNISNARTMCVNMNTPESIMLAQGVARIGKPVEEIRQAMDKSGALEISKLEKNLNILNIVGRIAPMFGFIGTIIGVIVIFYEINQSGTVEIKGISSGLYQKMISSCSGLVVGVIAFVCYHWLNTRIDRLANRMEDLQIKFLDMLNEPTK